MQRGSSVNFQPVQSAMHAVSHADRTVRPTYLLPPECSLGTVVVVDDRGAVAKTLEAKMALASRQAKAVKGYSPLWEGVMNLRRPEPDEDANAYRAECSQVVKDWCKAYEAMTGHAVLRADVHLDEGHIVEGVTMLNAHAHIICDKTNDKGRVIKMTPQKLRELQTATAEITNLERGVNSRVSGKKHITAHQYKYLAERNQLENQKAVEALKTKHKVQLDREIQLTTHNIKEARTAKAQVLDLKTQIAQLKAQYDQDRATLKASGEATQSDYQALKKTHEATLAELKKAHQTIHAQASEIDHLKAELKASRKKNEPATPAPPVPAPPRPPVAPVTRVSPPSPAPPPPAFAVLTITDTTTQAFKDLGRNEEAARIVLDAAAIIEEEWDGTPFDLRDTNGNAVGTCVEVARFPNPPPDGAIQLVMPRNPDLVGTLRACATKLREIVTTGVEMVIDSMGKTIAKLTVTPALHPAPENQPRPDEPGFEP
jgi:hypothetical protein